MQIFSQELKRLIEDNKEKKEDIKVYFNGLKELKECLEILFQKKGYLE